MEAVQNMKSKTVSELVESCLETVREGWERTLARALEWTLHPTEEDAVSELARSELIFLTLISALSSLDAEEEAGESEDSPSHDQSKRPRKDPRSSPSQQVRRYRLVARRRRSRRQGGRGQGKKGKQAPSHQEVRTSPSQEMGKSTTDTTPVSKAQTFASPTGVAKPSTGGIPKIRQQSSQRVHSPATGAIPKSRKSERTESPAAVDRLATVSFPEARQVISTASQTEESPTSRAVKVTSAVTKAEAQRQLWEGVKRDDSLKIEEAVLYGADLEEVREGDEMTALTVAAREGRAGAVRALLRLGARVEGRGGEWQRTALLWASYRGHEAVVRELLAAGASVGAEDSKRYTPLHLASYWGNLTIARLLVETGADLNTKTSWGDTPLSDAVRRGHTSVAEYLRSVGATT